MFNITNKINRVLTKRKLRGHDISTSRNVFHQILNTFAKQNQKKTKNLHLERSASSEDLP